MAVSKAQQKAVNKYMATNYDRINLTMPKGKRDIIKAHADAQSESVNAFIGRAIDETMERDKRNISGKFPKTKEEKQAAMERLKGLMADMPEDIDPDKVRGERINASKIAQQATATSQGAGVVSLPSEALEAAQEAAEKAGETVAEFVGRAVATQAERDRLIRSIKPKQKAPGNTPEA